MSKVWQGQRPSNIAVIKYMGKKDYERNIPSNASLSWTLDHLVTQVELHESSQDHWEPLPSDYPFAMSETGRMKYLKHLQLLKEHFSLKQNFLIRSGNNFPADCGIASSASSFAALTEVCCEAFSELTGQPITTEEKALLSARGSGSSCRSFWRGWVQWDEDCLGPVSTELTELHHMVILVGSGAKKVSSSQAHKRVSTSSLFAGRLQRSQERLHQVKQAMDPLDWEGLYQLMWAEFWDMHALFETSRPPFGYFLPGTLEVLNRCRSFWDEQGDGPLVTMDAGPNIHCLWRPDQADQAQKFFKGQIQGQWTCLSDLKGIGFAQV